MHGLVITQSYDPQSDIFAAVFVSLKDNILFIKHSKDGKEQNLEFGDCISFNEHAVVNGIIQCYQKEYSFCESRITAKHCQVKGVCVFSPSVKTKCYSDVFGTVFVPSSFAQRFRTDVAVSAWLTVELNERGIVSFIFAEFIDIADDQSYVLCTPWNRISKNYLADYDDNEDIASTDDGNGNASRTVDVVNAPVENEIFESFGLRNGVHDVICFQYPHIACYVVYNPPNSASTIGDVIKFDAVYSSPLNAYLIAWPQRVQFALSYQYKLVNSKYLIEMRVAGDESLPLGYFHAQDEHLGMVYDRHAILAPALLHASRNAVFDVAVSDIGPSRFCRLTIENAIGYTQKLLESCHNLQHKTLKDLEGVMIGWEQVFVREYPVLNFRFNDFSTRNWEDLKTGTWIKFTAVIDGGLPKFVIQEWSAISGGVTESIDYVFIDEDFKFQTKCQYKNELHVFESKSFGFIDDPNQVCSRLKTDGPTRLWISKGDDRSLTPFIVCSLDRPESKGTVKDHLYRRVMEARRERKELLDAAEEDVRKLTLSDAQW